MVTRDKVTYLPFDSGGIFYLTSIYYNSNFSRHSTSTVLLDFYCIGNPDQDFKEVLVQIGQYEPLLRMFKPELQQNIHILYTI
jgi:hypothetical protein